MTDLVYPGAVHHRFEHSLGVCHVAERIANHLGLSDEEVRHVRLAALVHDIGHGPFSHVSEEPLAAVNAEWLKSKNLDSDKIHEQIGLDIVRSLLLRESILNQTEADEVCAILDTTRRRKRTIAAEIVSGPVDADKMDYLLRDSLMAGVKYGVFDLERLILGLVEIKDGEDRYIGVHEDDVPALDQYLMARYNMHAQVYGHKTRMATDLMLGRAVLNAIEDGDEKIRTAYTYNQADTKALTDYLDFDDRRLLDHLSSSISQRAKNLANRLQSRHLVKRVFNLPLSEVKNDELVERLTKDQTRQSALDELREMIMDSITNIVPECLFVEVVASKAIRKSSVPDRPDPNEIKIKTDYSREAKSLTEVSGFFRDYKHTTSHRLVVYSNIDPENGQSSEDCRDRIVEVVKDHLGMMNHGKNNLA